MDYFTSPTDLAYALLFIGLAVAAASVAATISTVTFRPGSPAAVADRMSFRIAGIAGAAFIAVGAVPILFAPARSILAALGQ
ncbi:MAG TPA: hypothetical protein VF867_18875 [Arthrobacter sp.]